MEIAMAAMAVAAIITVAFYYKICNANDRMDAIVRRIDLIERRIDLIERRFDFLRQQDDGASMFPDGIPRITSDGQIWTPDMLAEEGK